MNPVQVLGGLLAGISQYIQAKRIQGQLRDVFDIAEAVNNWVARVITALADVFTQELGAIRYSDRYAQQIGHDLEQIEGDQQYRWNQLFDRILPHSLKHAFGVAQTWAINYFSPPITDLYNHVQSLDTSRATDENWLYGWVVPNERLLLKFRDDFFAGDQPSIDVLINWLRHPADFATWATPPIVGTFIAYLAAHGHETSRDNLARIMVDAWSEVPNDVWESILRWSVTDK